MKKLSLLFMMMTVLLSCSKDDDPIINKTKIVGTWELYAGNPRVKFIKYESNGTYKASYALSDIDKSKGIGFKVDGDRIIYDDEKIKQKDIIVNVSNSFLELSPFDPIFGEDPNNKPVYKYKKIN